MSLVRNRLGIELWRGGARPELLDKTIAGALKSGAAFDGQRARVRGRILHSIRGELQERKSRFSRPGQHP